MAQESVITSYATAMAASENCISRAKKGDPKTVVKIEALTKGDFK
jgi:hypothetical protein